MPRREGVVIPKLPLRFFGVAEPAVRVECVRVGEDVLVHEAQADVHAYWGLWGIDISMRNDLIGVVTHAGLDSPLLISQCFTGCQQRAIRHDYADP